MLLARFDHCDGVSQNRTLALLAWCGAGTGRCTGYPIYERVPDQLLRSVPIEDIIAALLDPRADSRHYAGALRHLVGWKARTNQKQDIAALPRKLTARLVELAQVSDDQDKRARADDWLD
jgi:hypothetical protein